MESPEERTDYPALAANVHFYTVYTFTHGMPYRARIDVVSMPNSDKKQFSVHFYFVDPAAGIPAPQVVMPDRLYRVYTDYADFPHVLRQLKGDLYYWPEVRVYFNFRDEIIGGGVNLLNRPTPPTEGEREGGVADDTPQNS